MCGRFALETNAEKLIAQFGVQLVDNILSSSNIAPTETVLCIKQNAEKLVTSAMSWGIKPWYTAGKKPILLINARAESVEDKPAFKQSLTYRRCLLLMSGFYEWRPVQTTKGMTKQPYYFSRQDNKFLAIAAIWEAPDQGHLSASCCLLTTGANSDVLSIHERMPWALNEEQQKDWLVPRPFLHEDLHKMQTTANKIKLTCYPVSLKVNKASYKHKDCIKPIDSVD